MAALRDTLITGATNALYREESTYDLRFNDPNSRSWIASGLSEFFLYNDEMTIILPYLSARDVVQLMYCSKDFYMRFSINDVWSGMLDRDFKRVVLNVHAGIAFPLELLKNDSNKYPDRLLRLKSLGELAVDPSSRAEVDAMDEPQYEFSPPDNQELVSFETTEVLLRYEYDADALPLAVEKMKLSKKAGQSVVNRLLGDVQEVLQPDSPTIAAGAKSSNNDLVGNDSFNIMTLKSVFIADQGAALDYYFRFVATLSFPYTHYAFTKTVGTDVSDSSAFTTVKKAANVEGYYAQFSQHFPELLLHERHHRRIRYRHGLPLPISYRNVCRSMVDKELSYMKVKAQLDRTFVVGATFLAVCGLQFAFKWLNGQKAFNDYLGFKMVTSQFDKFAASPVSRSSSTNTVNGEYDILTDMQNGAKLALRNTGKMLIEVGWWFPFVLRFACQKATGFFARKKIAEKGSPMVALMTGELRGVLCAQEVAKFSDDKIDKMLTDMGQRPINKQPIEIRIEQVLFVMETVLHQRALQPLFLTSSLTSLLQLLVPESHARKSQLLGAVPAFALVFSSIWETTWLLRGTKQGIDNQAKSSGMRPLGRLADYWQYTTVPEHVFFSLYPVDKIAATAVCYRYGVVPMIGFSSALAVASVFY